MPKTIVHLWIAKQLSEMNSLLLDSDFYLGSILPDAIYSRSIDVQQNYFITHIFSDKQTWEADVIRSFESITSPTLLEIGYYAHIFTDMVWRKLMREYYDENNVPFAKRSEFDKIIVPISIRKLFLSEQDYFSCINFAEKSIVSQYPYMITKEDVLKNFSYARNIFSIEKVISSEKEIGFALPDYRIWCNLAINYLQMIMLGEFQWKCQ